MKKLFLICTLVYAVASYAQDDFDFDFDLPENLDQNEDTTRITTIADIVNVQELVTTSNTTASHFNQVWGRQKYFNISYGGVKMTPKEDIPLGYNFNSNKAPVFKSDWGLAIVLGRNYALHKKPIANTLKFNIDFTYFDLNMTHFKAEGDKNTKVYDSSATWIEHDEDDNSDNERSYIPWCLQKYKADFGMSVGPSLTIAPFNYINGVPGLHYMKLNIFYHIGYHASILWMVNDDKLDANEEASANDKKSDYYSDKDEGSGLKMNWGHGLTSTFGMSLSWKTIGVGFEIRNTNLSYKSVIPETYGHNSYKFSTKSTRVYLQIRY